MSYSSFILEQYYGEECGGGPCSCGGNCTCVGKNLAPLVKKFRKPSKKDGELRHAALTGVPDSGEKDESWRPEIQKWVQGDPLWAQICDGWDAWKQKKSQVHEGNNV